MTDMCGDQQKCLNTPGTINGIIVSVLLCNLVIS